MDPFVPRDPAGAEDYVSLGGFVFVVRSAISILISVFGVAELAPVGHDFFAFVFLPSSDSLVVPGAVQVLAGGPFVNFVVQLFLSGGVSVLVRGVSRVAVGTVCFSSVWEGVAEDRPFRVF